MSSQQQSKQQIKLNQLNAILSTNNNNQQTLNEVEETINEVNLWKVRELAISDGGLLNGTFVFICFLCFMLLLGGSFGICWYLIVFC